jgi:hypothetical protein
MMNARPAAAAALLCLFAATPLAAQQRVTLPARDNVLSGQPAAVFTVGREEGADHELFANIASVGFDGRDNLYILDRGNFRVVVFDARGRFVRTLGKRGDGPGEFTMPTQMSVADDGSVIVGDIGRTSLSFFDAAGSYRGIPMPQDGGRPTPGTGMFRDANGIVMRTLDINPEALARSGGVMASPIRRFAPVGEGMRAQTIFEIPQPAPAVSQQGGRTMVVMAPPLFSPQPFWALLPNGGLAVAHEATYTIRITDARGNVQRIIERPIQPRRVTREDRERGIEQRRAQASSSGNTMTVRMGPGGTSFGGGEAPPRSIDELIRNTEFADVIPVISRFTADRTGRMWVARAGRRVGEAGPIDLLAADGRYIGTVANGAVPDAVSSSGLAAYIVTDDLGVARVAVRRLPTNWR